MISLGNTYRDKVSGFRGVATGYCTYITGCNQVLLQGRSGKDGKVAEAAWFDEQRLGTLKAAVVRLDNSRARGFGPPAPIR